MLGRLARWLRVLGYDTLYDAALPDAVLVSRANVEGRILLTRDRHLLRDLHPLRAVELRDDEPLEQLRAVLVSLSLGAPDELFTRCLVCNTALSAPIDRSEAVLRLPPRARELEGPVRECPRCRRTYWPGSHVRRMREALERAFPEWWAGHAASPR